MKKNYERTFMWVKGKLKEVRSCWLWLFDFLNIGFVLPPGDIALKEVTKLFTGTTDLWYHIYVDDDEICCTASHPFFIEGKGFVRASDLQIGYKVLNERDKTIKLT